MAGVSAPSLMHGISILIYIATAISVSVELYYANTWYTATCMPNYAVNYETGYNTSQGETCWPFLLVAWAVALPAAALGAVASAVYLHRCHRVSRTATFTRPLRRPVMWTAAVVVLWFFVALLIGWIQPTLADEGELPGVNGFDGSMDSGYAGTVIGGGDVTVSTPVTGVFQWAVDVYNAVMPYDTEDYGWSTDLSFIFDSARAGMAGAVFVTTAFCWSVIMFIFAAAYKSPATSGSSAAMATTTGKTGPLVNDQPPMAHTPQQDFQAGYVDSGYEHAKTEEPV